MNQRERTNYDATQPPPADPTVGTPGANLNAMRQAGAAMIAAADGAIDRVLSGDSHKFNVAIQQQGGQ